MQYTFASGSQITIDLKIVANSTFGFGPFIYNTNTNTNTNTVLYISIRYQ